MLNPNNNFINKNITINSLKYDGEIHRSWSAELHEENNSLLTFFGKFEKEVKHSKLGVIRRNTLSYEYYWLDRWYNIFRFHEPEGNLRNFYCNINLPPIFENGVLNYIDLDIDILVWKDFDYQILDLDEFKENASKFSYPKTVKEKCIQTVKELEHLIKSRQFPFDFIEAKP